MSENSVEDGRPASDDQDPRLPPIEDTAPTPSEATPASTAGESPPSIWMRLVTEHTGLVLSASLFALLTWRILAMAGYNTTTAQAIVQAGGAANVALASAIASVPMVFSSFLWVAVAFGYRWVYDWTGMDPGQFRLNVIIVVSIVMCLFVPWLLVAPAALVVIVGGFRGYLARRKRDPGTEVPSRQGLRLEVAILGFLPILFLSSALPYLPAERVKVEGQREFTGYTVGERDDAILVMRHNHGIRSYKLAEVTREYCAADASWWLQTPVGLAGRTEDYPACP